MFSITRHLIIATEWCGRSVGRSVGVLQIISGSVKFIIKILHRHDVPAVLPVLCVHSACMHSFDVSVVRRHSAAGARSLFPFAIIFVSAIVNEHTSYNRKITVKSFRARAGA